MKNFKSIFVILLSVVLVVGLFLINGCTKKEPETIKIGAILPLTGPAAFIGDWHKQGFELAKEEINETSSVKVEINYEDSANDPKTGINAYNHLKFKKVNLYMSAFSAVTMPLIPLINEEKKAMFVTSVSYPEIAKRSEFLYRYNITSDEEAKMMSKFLIESKVNKVNIFYINDEYGIGALTTFKENYENKGGEIDFETSFGKNDIDFKSSIFKSNRDLPYFIAGYGKAYTILLKQINQLVKNAKIYTVYSMDIEEFIKPLIGSGLEVVYTRPQQRDSKERVAFESKFEQKYNKKPNLVNILCYDLLKIMFEIRKLSPSLEIEEIMSQKDKLKLKSAYGYTIDILPSGEIKVPLEIATKRL